MVNTRTAIKVAGWIIATLIALATLALGYFQQTGYFNHPEIVSVVHVGTEKTCPITLTLPDYSDYVSFELLFKNIGRENTELTVTADSDSLLFKEKSKKFVLDLNSLSYTPFKYEIINNHTSISKKNNFTIYYSYSYTDSKKVKNSGRYSCIYDRTSSSYPTFRLIN